MQASSPQLVNKNLSNLFHDFIEHFRSPKYRAKLLKVSRFGSIPPRQALRARTRRPKPTHWLRSANLQLAARQRSRRVGGAADLHNHCGLRTNRAGRLPSRGGADAFKWAGDPQFSPMWGGLSRLSVHGHPCPVILAAGCRRNRQTGNLSPPRRSPAG